MIATTQKTEGWEDRLDQFFKERASIPFRWGIQDCCTFAYEALKVMMDREPIEDQSWRYTTRFGAFKMLKNKHNVGFLNTFIKVFEEMGFEEVENVMYGDILFARIIIDDPEEAVRFGDVTMAVGYNDLGAIVAPGEDGLRLIDEYELVRAWRI